MPLIPKKSSTKLGIKRFCRFLASAIAMLIVFSASAFALPTGWNVVEGNVTVDITDNIMTITSISDQAIISYVSFDLASGETINFIMPGASSSIINKVIGGNISNIAGSINANGIIGLQNTAGIQIANTAQINAAALLASTLNIANMDANRIDLMKDPGTNNAGILNEGQIDVSQFAIIAGSGVANLGSIFADDGTIHLSVGDKMSFHLSNNTTVDVVIDEGIHQVIGSLNTGIHNKGLLVGHQVELRARLADEVISQAINQDGMIQATHLNNEAGSIVLKAEGGNNLVTNTGILFAGASANEDGRLATTSINQEAGRITIQGTAALNSGVVIATGGMNEKGGTVHMFGDTVINDGSLIDVSGDIGGGEVLIGGDFQGTGVAPRATLNVASNDSIVFADAMSEGDGGRVIFWSDEDTFFSGGISARGGVLSGNGGFAEVSGKKYLDMQGVADLTPGNDTGVKGTLLLDPTNINIVEFDPNDLNPVLWLDGSDASTISTSGSFVTQWRDKSGNNNHANPQAVANRPQTGVSSLNGNNVLTFDGGDDVLTITDHASLDNSNGMSFFTVVTPKDSDSNPRGIFAKRVSSGSPASQYGYTLFYWHSNRLYADFHTQNNRFNTSNAYAPNNTYMHSMIYDGTQTSALRMSLYDNTVLNRNATESSATIPDTAANFYVGMLNYNYGAGGHLGDIAEILIYGSALNTNDRYLVNQYQAAKWGQTLGTTLNQFSEITDGYLKYLTETADVSLLADQNITIENMSDNLLDLGNRNLTLTATNGNIVFNDTNDVLRTEGSNITMTAGGTMTLGTLSTRGASGALNTGNVLLTNTATNNITLNGGAVGGNLTVDGFAGSQVVVNNTTVIGNTDIDINGSNGDITGTGNVFTGTSRLDTNDYNGGNITMTGNFIGGVDLNGDQLTITDTVGDLLVTNLISGSRVANSVISATAAGADITLSTYDIGSGGGGYLEVNANDNVNYTKAASPWTLDERLVLNSTNGGDITINNMVTSQQIEARSAAYAVGTVANGTYVSTNGGDLTINNLNSTSDVTVLSGINNVSVGSGAGNAVANVRHLNLTATGDAIGYGSITGNVGATASRVWMHDTNGDLTSVGLSASGASGWNGGADETLVAQAINGDIRGVGFTTTGAGNMRLQAGSTATLGTGYSVDVTNVSANQNAEFHSAGADAGVSIRVGGTSNVGGNITATGYNASNQFVGTTGRVDITTTSGNIDTAMVWSGEDIYLTANNGSITQNTAAYGTGYNNSKTLYAADDIVLTAQGAGSSHIDTGVQTLSTTGNLTVLANGSTGGTSIRVIGRVDGNGTFTNTSNGNTPGDIWLGTSLGGSVTNLDDTNQTMDIRGNVVAKSNGTVYMYGAFGLAGTLDIIGDRIVANADKWNLNFTRAQTTATTGNGIDLTAYRGNLLGTNISTAGSANIVLQAGNSLPLDKMTLINLSSVTTAGNLNATAYGSNTGNQTGNSITITGSTGGSTSTTSHVNGTVSTP